MHQTLLAIVRAEPDSDPGRKGAQSLAVDEDAVAAAGECEGGARERNVGKGTQPDLQEPVGGGGTAAEKHVNLAGVQVGEKIGEAFGRFTQVDGALERSVERRAE